MNHLLSPIYIYANCVNEGFLIKTASEEMADFNQTPPF